MIMMIIMWCYYSGHNLYLKNFKIACNDSTANGHHPVRDYCMASISFG